MTKPVCTVMVGLPALGKSTMISRIAKPDTWIYSTDMYIDSIAEDNGISYSEAFASNIADATKFNEQKLRTMITFQKDVIWDQTNLSVKKRKSIVDRMKAAGYVVNCICLMPPEEGWLDDMKVWKQRLEGRPGKTIPSHILASMYESFTVPTMAEGFDVIEIYNMYGILP